MNRAATKTIFIVFQIILTILLTGFFSMATNNEVDDLLNTSVVEQYFTAFLGIIIGVALPGLLYLNRLKRSKVLLRSMFQSTLGLLLFFLVYEIINSLLLKDLPYLLHAVLIPYMLSLTGAIAGFYYTRKEKRNTTTE